MRGTAFWNRIQSLGPEKRLNCLAIVLGRVQMLVIVNPKCRAEVVADLHAGVLVWTQNVRVGRCGLRIN